jgi:midasin
VLDHRKQVFIPELGQTFECPESFRIFACQNPLNQGGGRKGLPASFLNRFTKVHLDSLEFQDLQLISQSMFPSISSTTVEIVNSFNQLAHREIMVDRLYAHRGSPWDFNLRDVFRILELVSLIFFLFTYCFTIHAL